MRYTYREAPNCIAFVALHRKHRYTVSFRKVCERGHDRLSATVQTNVLNRVEKDPSVSPRTLVREGGISQTKVMNIFHKNQYHPYHFTLVQGLMCSDFKQCVTFCSRLLDRDIEERNFLRKILWKMRVTFYP